MITHLPLMAMNSCILLVGLYAHSAKKLFVHVVKDQVSLDLERRMSSLESLNILELYRVCIMIKSWLWYLDLRTAIDTVQLLDSLLKIFRQSEVPM